MPNTCALSLGHLINNTLLESIVKAADWLSCLHAKLVGVRRVNEKWKGIQGSCDLYFILHENLSIVCREGIKISRRFAETSAMKPITDYELHPGTKEQVINSQSSGLAVLMSCICQKQIHQYLSDVWLWQLQQLNPAKSMTPVAIKGLIIFTWGSSTEIEVRVDKDYRSTFVVTAHLKKTRHRILLSDAILRQIDIVASLSCAHIEYRCWCHKLIWLKISNRGGDTHQDWICACRVMTSSTALYRGLCTVEMPW